MALLKESQSNGGEIANSAASSSIVMSDFRIGHLDWSCAAGAKERAPAGGKRRPWLRSEGHVQAHGYAVGESSFCGGRFVVRSLARSSATRGSAQRSLRPEPPNVEAAREHAYESPSRRAHSRPPRVRVAARSRRPRP